VQEKIKVRVESPRGTTGEKRGKREGEGGQGARRRWGPEGRRISFSRKRQEKITPRDLKG